MRKIICLVAFQTFVCLVFCQTGERKPTIADTIIRIVNQFPEFMEVQRNADSLQLASHSTDGKYNAGVSVAIKYKDNGEIANKIADVSITEQFDTVVKVIYAIKYDMELKKIISFKKEN
jgi:hypothetical protein